MFRSNNRTTELTEEKLIETSRDFRIPLGRQDLWIVLRPEPRDQPVAKVPWMLPAEVPALGRHGRRGRKG